MYLVHEMRATLDSVTRVQRIIVWTSTILDINGMYHISVYSTTITQLNISSKVCVTSLILYIILRILVWLHELSEGAGHYTVVCNCETPCCNIFINFI